LHFLSILTILCFLEYGIQEMNVDLGTGVGSVLHGIHPSSDDG
jgi:hypothetical protein